eukprot:NODE_743_length_4284_cov_0.513501.p3 type:complete len:125 gc:universal NODE_743_length_4284_cov_0.513501:1423-1049(-)
MKNATNSATGEAPSMLLFKSKIDPIKRERIFTSNDITELRRDANQRAYNKRQKRLTQLNSKKGLPEFKNGEKVYMTNSWKQGKLDYYFVPEPIYFIKMLSTNIAQLQDKYKFLITCHMEQLRKL